MSAYTPGRWIVVYCTTIIADDIPGKDCDGKSCADGGMIATTSSVWVSPAACKANAVLMAEAPELLRLLKEATKDSKRIGTTGAWLLEALNAIAKAEGRAG